MIGRLVVKVLKAGRPRARYTVGKGSTGIWLISHLAGARMVDALIGRAMGLRPGR